jgi:hypothetical protein
MIHWYFEGPSDGLHEYSTAHRCRTTNDSPDGKAHINRHQMLVSVTQTA